MKVLSLKLNDKTYLTGKITAFLSKEALKIQKDTLSIAKKGKGLSEGADEEGMDAALELLTILDELRDRRVWLICEVYHKQFSPDELMQSLSDEEIDQEINRILYGVSGVVAKN